MTKNQSNMKLHNFQSIYPLINDLYGITMDPNSFEDIALNGWQLIGNKYSRIYRYTTSTTNKRVQIPCNASEIEGVFDGQLDYQESLPHTSNTNYDWVESYAESHGNRNLLYNSGRLIKYRQEGDELVFDQNYGNLTILYHGIIVDEDGLPMVTDKEIQALAAYCAYTDLYKRSIALNNAGLMQMATVIKADWLRLCNSARIPNLISQNEWNEILDVKTRWDRKTYGHSYKPLL